MKTTFGRQFALTASLILLCVTFLGAGFRALLYNDLVQTKEDALEINAFAVAELAAAYETMANLGQNWDFRMSLSFLSNVSETDTVISDLNGEIILCSCNKISCAHKKNQLTPILLEQVMKGGVVHFQGDVPTLYPESRYYVAVPLTVTPLKVPIGVVMVSTSSQAITEMHTSTFQIFFLTALVVLLIAMAVTSILARNEAQILRSLTDTAKRFGRGDLHARAKVDPNNTVEMNELASAFNNMAISLEQSEMRRQEFVANVSHELKTPMTTISGFMDGMLDGTIPPTKHRKYMQTVSDEVRRLSRLVRSMLDISKLQSQGIPEDKKQKFDLTETVGQILLSFEQKINGKSLEVDVKMPDKAVNVWGEMDTITQVIYNLIDNGVKFCEEQGTISIEVSIHGGKARVGIGNTGPTIDPVAIPLLFDRFQKLDKSRSEDRDGYGLGLYIVKTILSGHGEDITVISENNKTEFSFHLPIKNK